MGAYIIINMEGHISLGKTAQNSDSDSTLNRLERFVLSTELSDLHIFRFKGRGSPSGDSFRNYDAARIGRYRILNYVSAFQNTPKIGPHFFFFSITISRIRKLVER